MSYLYTNKSLELDKICRVCLMAKKDMKPLFEDKLLVADMLMELAHIEIENTDGWPDKICIQCVHSVSRCHAFKNRVERSDQDLRSYIKSLTVVIEEPAPIIEVSQPSSQGQKSRIQIQHNDQRQHQPNQSQTQPIQTIQPQVMLSNGHLHNSQLLNAQLTQIVNASQLGQLIHGNTVQVVNGQPVVFQRTSTGEERCEIIVHPDLDDAEFFEDVIENTEDVIELDHGIIEEDPDDEMDDELHFVEELEEMDQEDEEHIQEEEEDQDIEHEYIQPPSVKGVEEEDEAGPDYEPEPEQDIEEDIGQEEMFHEEEERLDDSNDDEPDKEFVAEFISSQTTCLGPGRFVCNLCRKEFKQSKWLQNHMKSHSNWIKANCKKQPQCEICHRSFKGPGMLKMHMKTHEQKPYQCGNCSKLFSSPFTLNSHMTNKHATEHCKFKCSQCEEVFYNLDLLKGHIETNCNKDIISEDSN